ncbi:MAG: hypothetical protein Q8M29_05825 [Bacteroidota bacterium]|nr:hypothetical protein [Bacteroidota bacterium]
MVRIIYIWILVTVCTLKLFSQDSLSSELLRLEHKIYLCKNDTVKTEYIYDKLNCLLRSGITGSQTLNEINRIDYLLLNDSVLPEFYWNAAVILYINKESTSAYHYVSKYEDFKADSSIEFLLLKTLIVSKIDTALASSTLKKLGQYDSGFSCLSCLVEINNYELKGKKLLVNASAILPGLGSMLNGNVLKGFTSLALTGSSVLLSYYLLQNKCYFNFVGLGVTFGYKFYTGNIRLTNKLVNEKEGRKKTELTKKCELSYKNILVKYPLLLK